MNPIRNVLFLASLLIPLLGITGCAPAEQDADDVANTAIQGLEGRGRLSTEKVMKDQIGNEFQ